MLSYKNGMIFHWGLLAVIVWVGRGESFGDKFAGVLGDSCGCLLVIIGLFAWGELKTATEF